MARLPSALCLRSYPLDGLAWLTKPAHVKCKVYVVAGCEAMPDTKVSLSAGGSRPKTMSWLHSGFRATFR